MKWDLEGKEYEIFRNNEVIWKGDVKEFIDKNLESGNLYTYKVVAYDDQGNLLEISDLKTSTARNLELQGKGKKTNLVNSNISINSGKDYVNLSWDSLEDNDGRYKIYRDNKLINETKDNYFYDTDVDSDTVYTYEIEASTVISNEKKEELNKKIAEKNITLSDEELKELYEEKFSLITIVETNKQNNIAELKTTNSLSTVDPSKDFTRQEISEVSYTTFIPQDFVKAPNFINLEDPSMIYFKGDDRGFDVYHGFNPITSFRTRTIANVGWTYAERLPTLSATNYAGQSEAYSDNQGINLIAYDTANANQGIETYDSFMNNNQIMWNVVHNLGMPFSPLYPNITYSYIGFVTAGGISISGSHDKAPHHEMYIRIRRGQNIIKPVTIFRHEGGSFLNLFPGSPQHHFNITL